MSFRWLAISLGLLMGGGACLDLDALQAGLGRSQMMDAAVVVQDLGSTKGPPDLAESADLKPASGCADGRGLEIGGASSPFPVWSCPGVFSGVNSFFARCASGFTVCKSVQIGKLACEGVQGGMFVAQKGFRQPGPFPPDSAQASYSWTGGGNQTRGIMYCGELGTGGYAAPTGVGGFFRIVPCDMGMTPGVSSFACPVVAASDQDFDQVSNSNSQNGVLCCPASTQ